MVSDARNADCLMVDPSYCRQTRHYSFTGVFKVMHRRRDIRPAAGQSRRHGDVLIICLLSSCFRESESEREREGGKREE